MTGARLGCEDMYVEYILLSVLKGGLEAVTITTGHLEGLTSISPCIESVLLCSETMSGFVRWCPVEFVNVF